MTAPRRRDDGMILIPTLILSVVLSVVVVAVLGYVTTGVMTSRVTTERTEDATQATAAIYWAIEDLATGVGACQPVVDVPPAALPLGEAAEVVCSELVAEDAATGSTAQVLLAVGADESATGRIATIVEYRPSDPAPRAIRIADWATGVDTSG